MSELNHPGLGENPPTIFDGDLSKAQEFMGDFCHYCMLNPHHLNLIMPFQSVIMCLMLMKGPKVDDWVAKEMNFMEERQANGTDPNNPAAWNSFKAVFDDMFVPCKRPKLEEVSPLHKCSESEPSMGESPMDKLVTLRM
jgi:hypothetical protein